MDDEETWWKWGAIVGAVIGLIGGAISGFEQGGVGGAILYAPLGALFGVFLGGLLGAIALRAVGLVIVAAVVGIPAGILYLLVNGLWGVGK